MCGPSGFTPLYGLGTRRELITVSVLREMWWGSNWWPRAFLLWWGLGLVLAEVLSRAY